MPSSRCENIKHKHPRTLQASLMQEIDVLLGVTGTGLVNGVWMRRGSVGVQLFPYGVSAKGGVDFKTQIGGGYFSC